MEMLIKKIPDISGLVTTTVLNTKISEVKNKRKQSRKQIMKLKYQKLSESTLLLLIVINLPVTYLMQRYNKKN